MHGGLGWHRHNGVRVHAFDGFRWSHSGHRRVERCPIPQFPQYLHPRCTQIPMALLHIFRSMGGRCHYYPNSPRAPGPNGITQICCASLYLYRNSGISKIIATKFSPRPLYFTGRFGLSYWLMARRSATVPAKTADRICATTWIFGKIIRPAVFLPALVFVRIFPF
jgi:hypothetical protein